MIPKAHFGQATATPVDWRTALEDDDDKDDDAETATSEDVIGMLGFDPEEED